MRDKELKLEEVSLKDSHTLGEVGERDTVRKGKWIRDEKFVSGRGERVKVDA